MKRVTCSLLLWILLLPQLVQGKEEILSYDSHIQVQVDGSMWVEETIRVRAEGKKIKRGIYRDFPTDYKDKLGNQYRVVFQLLDVLRDGAAEPHHLESRSNGVRIYFGDSNTYLKHGVYTYTLRYSTNRQLGFFENHDELYWNATGNEWDFPILQTNVRVTLPPAVPVDSIRVEGYSGVQGSRGQDYAAGVDGGQAWYQMTRVLRAREGLTIVAMWPKGYVIEPSREQRIKWLLSDNQSLLVAGGGTILLLAYYLLVWLRVGRDPEAGIVIPHYSPPSGYSPASMRFIQRMGYDNSTFGAAIVNMAVAGYLRIEESSKGAFSLHKTGALPKLATGESAIASALFGSGGSDIALTKSNHKKIGKAVRAHKGALKRDYEKRYFVTNGIYSLPGMLLTIVVVVAGVVSVPNTDQGMITGFMAVWLAGWTAGVYMLLKRAFLAWRAVLSGGGVVNLIGAVFITLFAVPFVAGEVFGIGIVFTEGSPLLVLMLGVLVGINITFYQWMKAPTLVGRKLLDQLEGFALYLDVAEKDELKFKNPPEKTPTLFERYLPFAIALGVEEQWGDRFSNVLAQAQDVGERYSPAWYSGRSWDHHNLTGFSSAVGGSMATAIASSSTAPGSSSGSGGGGSSGGGGGGGGGGGW